MLQHATIIFVVFVALTVEPAFSGNFSIRRCGRYTIHGRLHCQNISCFINVFEGRANQFQIEIPTAFLTSRDLSEQNVSATVEIVNLNYLRDSSPPHLDHSQILLGTPQFNENDVQFHSAIPCENEN